ncbi:LuxR C-terminal-related transcriptional regulator [Kitasatospora sp. YST-16]|uniref:helix-turn-helix transcriptional regulator n=1 Tax=Kitasatospora sp. YST-16 TaxID=2998080 RepID=UPI002284FBFD|nr:LuxR C-terminal-related transcriptional regulator [Kitasatospora sp. YST-16]WAL74662.1 LuxR C-terminal-related transcriptional regulator [Kitasatospora sp. YST-16]WNW40720.1 LuxR C-terminal-related transcriptional regulator [Streptomyces sp. Li-HN-5-13]
MLPVPAPSMRPDDSDAFRQALRTAREGSGAPVVFGGPVQNGVLHLTQHIGLRTAGLRGLSVPAGTGLGGHVVVARRPVAVADYGAADSITHDYDTPVLAERLCSVVAVPVVVAGSVRGVLYGAVRERTPLGERAAGAVVRASRQLARELALRDEVDHRLRLQRALETGSGPAPGRGRDEEVRALHAELRLIAQAVGDDALRGRVLDAARRLAGLDAPRAAESNPHPPLAPREVDVLAQVALGCSNAETAARLSLSPETVKAYLRSAMRKLDARTRFEAVVTARRQGMLP